MNYKYEDQEEINKEDEGYKEFLQFIDEYFKETEEEGEKKDIGKIG